MRDWGRMLSALCILLAISGPTLAAGSTNSPFLQYQALKTVAPGDQRWLACEDMANAGPSDFDGMMVSAQANFGRILIGSSQSPSRGVALVVGDLSLREQDGPIVTMRPWQGLPSTGRDVQVLEPRDPSKACRNPPALYIALFGEVFAIFEAADAAVEVCLRDEALCTNAAFGVLDITGDRKLSRAELARAIRVLGFFVPFLAKGTGEPASLEDSIASLSLAGMLGPTLAQNLIDGSDYDGDGQLSLGEVMQDRGKVDMTSVLVVLRTSLTEQLGRSLDDVLGIAMKAMMGAL